MDIPQGEHDTRKNPGKQHEETTKEAAISLQQSDTTPFQQPHIYRPIPVRNFSYSSGYTNESPNPFPQSPPPGLTGSNNRSSDFLAQLNAKLLRSSNGSTYENGEDDGQPTRTKSFLNMKSTLFGIYDEVDTSTSGVPGTPLQTGAEMPFFGSRCDGGNGSTRQGNGLGNQDGGLRIKMVKRGVPMTDQPQTPVRKHSARRTASIVAKLFALFLFGTIYGIVVSHLHNRRELAAVQVGGVDHQSWAYLAGWGLAGVLLGILLPYVDLMADGGNRRGERYRAGLLKEAELSLYEKWNVVVRSVGAFMGIAFAIRRLPWESTLQLTVTLALVNPALWHLLDRTKNGLLLSLISTSLITSFIFLSNPDLLPSPVLTTRINGTAIIPSARADTSSPTERFAGVVGYDSLATATWVGSVVFCSCICFGGIGRRLAVLNEW